MGKVQKLPEHLIRLIAAGEVVERPASVLKELVENSLDAGATRIDVDVWGAGRTRLRVSDDGEGMTREDAEMALDHHATSKLSQFDDLYKLGTFGFRGEALPSIASVSRLELATCAKGEAQGWRLNLEGGKLLSAEPLARPQGTSIDAQDLFFNTPARSKFLKRDATERTHIVRTLEEIALAHPGVRFSLSIDGKEALLLPGHSSLGARLGDLWSLTVAEKLVEIDVQRGPCRLRGFVNDTQGHHATKAYQVLFVNQRPVQQRMLNFAIYEAYREWLPVGRHPVYALFVDIDPAMVDVNVHPTKREVRFTEERAVYDVLYRAIRDRFKTVGVSEPANDVPAQTPHWGDSASRITASQSQAAFSLQQPATSMFQTSMIADAGTAVYPSPQAPAAVPIPSHARYLGQYQQLYLLFEREGSLLIVDQHAAAERVLYEQLLAEVQAASVVRQPLLTPVLLDVSAAQASVMRSYIDAFQELGFGLETFGAQTFALKEWPSVLRSTRQAKRFLEEVTEALSQERPTDKTRVHHEIAARAACRAAIMAGDPVSSSEAAELLKSLSACERPMSCPHGRPTSIEMLRPDLDRKFRRS